MTMAAAAGLLLWLLGIVPAAAQTGPAGRAETLRYVTPGTVNTLDPTTIGATPEATALSMAIYDRLLRFAPPPPGSDAPAVSPDRLEGELAESVRVSPDGLVVTLTIRAGALWHDGTPVTAADVKWSLDRAVEASTTARAQVATGSLVRADQVTVLDGRTVEIRLPRPDRLLLANLATAYVPMINAAVARRHATPDDPWATDWLRSNGAAGGAFRVAEWLPGRPVVLARSDAWANGPRPGFARAIVQTVPEASVRATLVRRGDADVAVGLGPEEAAALAGADEAAFVSTPIPTGFGALVFNTRQAPFDDPRVRRALALAIPYEAIVAVLGGRVPPLFGATWTDGPPDGAFPQPVPLRQDLPAAAALLAEAGWPAGFGTTLSYAAIRPGFDPVAALIAEAFGRIGVRVDLAKLPDAAFAAAITAGRLPLLLERSFALFPSTEYFFRVFLSGTARWNFSGWRDPAVEALLGSVRFEPDRARAEEASRDLVRRFTAALPMAPIWRPTADVALARTVTGFRPRYNAYPDIRDLARR